MTAMTLGRPEFIPRELFRQYLSTRVLNRQFTVGGILPASFVVKHKMPWALVDGQKRYRPIDIVARGRALGCVIGPPREREYLHSAGELQRVQKQIAVAKHDLALFEASTRLTGAGLLDAEDIAKAAIDAAQHAKVSGIYFLVRNGKVDYVGQSINVFARVGSHQHVDAWAYIACEPDGLDVLESLYIYWLRPAGNGMAHDGSKSAPMSVTQIVNMVVRSPVGMTRTALRRRHAPQPTRDLDRRGGKERGRPTR